MEDPTYTFSPSDFFIVVVDDVARNLQLLSSVLRNHGYRVSPANSGAQALERLANVKADLILLDLMMPGMDGLEVCRKLKENPNTRDIPVVFLTASGELENVVNAFDLGAMDYITKPFYAPELLARVKTQLELKFSREALIRANERLREINNEKNEFMGMASHDLKSPLTSILGISQLIQFSPDMSREDTLKWLSKIESQSQRMVYIVKNLLDVNRIDRGELQVNFRIVDLAILAREIYEQHLGDVEAKDQAMSFECEYEQLSVRADQNLLMQVIENLVSNAIKYSPRGKAIIMRCYAERGNAVFYVEDEGPGLNDEDQTRLFKRFAKLAPEPTGGEHSSGLGLSIVKRLVEEMNGEIWFQSRLGEGSTFGVTFKLMNEGHAADATVIEGAIKSVT